MIPVFELLLMTGAVHGAALAIAAAAHNRLAFLFLFDHADDDSGDNADQHRAHRRAFVQIAGARGGIYAVWTKRTLSIVKMHKDEARESAV